MSMNILAMLLSFAMMLTGVGGEGQPAEAARTLVVSNVSLTYNGETVDLAPSLRVGASTDGASAVYDIGVDLNGETLFPIQLGVDDSGLTLLSKGNDVAVKVSAEALDALSEQMNALMAGMTTGDDESAEVMRYITEEYIPAYTALLEAMSDPEFREEVRTNGNAIFDELVDRGEGTPVVETIDGEEYALNEYSYSLDGEQIAALADAIYASNDTLNAYYEALFKMYELMPEEAGFSGVHSFADIFSMTQLDMRLDAVERISDDGEVETMDGVLTIDPAGMAQGMIEAEGGDPAEAEDVPPMEMYIHATQVGDIQDADVNFNYEIPEADVGIVMNFTGHSEGLENVQMRMNMELSEEGQSIGGLNLSVDAQTDAATGDQSYVLGYDINTPEAYVGIAANGVQAADGTASNSFALTVNSEDVNVALSFDADIVADEIEDLANGHEAAFELNDLSDEATSGLLEDPAFQGAIMQISGAMMTDAQKLMGDESVQQLTGLFAAMATPDYEEYDYDDDSFEGEEATDYETYGAAEDDGVLAFDEPQFTWLPDGWTLEESEVDTAYDWVNMTFTNGEGGTCYASFYVDNISNPVNYLVGDDGDISAVEGREITVNDYGDGDLAVSLIEGDIYCTLSFSGAELDMETIGQIVAGLTF